MFCSKLIKIVDMIEELEDIINLIHGADFEQYCIELLEVIYNYGREPGVNIYDLLHQIGSGIDELKN